MIVPKIPKSSVVMIVIFGAGELPQEHVGIAMSDDDENRQRNQTSADANPISVITTTAQSSGNGTHRCASGTR